MPSQSETKHQESYEHCTVYIDVFECLGLVWLLPSPRYACAWACLEDDVSLWLLTWEAPCSGKSIRPQAPSMPGTPFSLSSPTILALVQAAVVCLLCLISFPSQLLHSQLVTGGGSSALSRPHHPLNSTSGNRRTPAFKQFQIPWTSPVNWSYPRSPTSIALIYFLDCWCILLVTSRPRSMAKLVDSHSGVLVWWIPRA